MAVIVQEQVTGQGVAGVMFTRDPNTGDPEKITIALSYGLGEVCYNHNQFRNIYIQ
jgi:phosphoenolpyruvate synthase/pyruvate phosphate dikinase